MPTEVLYIRVPEGLKAETDRFALRHGTSLTAVVVRALEVYLTAQGIELEEASKLP